MSLVMYTRLCSLNTMYTSVSKVFDNIYTCIATVDADLQPAHLVVHVRASRPLHYIYK